MLELNGPALKSLLHHLLILWPWASHFISPSLSLVICEMGCGSQFPRWPPCIYTFHQSPPILYQGLVGVIKRIWQKGWMVLNSKARKPGCKRCCGFSLAFSLSLSPPFPTPLIIHSKGSQLPRPYGRTWMWIVQPQLGLEMRTQPSPTAWLQPHGRPIALLLSHSQTPGPPKLNERINICPFKLLNLGVIWYTVADK